jgi:hypothetical protein
MNSKRTTPASTVVNGSLLASLWLLAIAAFAQPLTAGEWTGKGGSGPKTLFSWNGCCKDHDAADAYASEDEESEYAGEGEFAGAATEEPEEEDPIATDRPDFTETSTTVGLGRVQLEMGYRYIEDRSGGTRTRTHSYPEALLRIGMLHEWFELRLGQNFGDETLFAAAASTGNSGAEDLYVGCKIALTEQCGWLPEMALTPQMTLPTGDPSFTADEVMPGLNWLYGWDVTECWSFAGSTQGNRERDDSGHYYTVFAQSLTNGFSITDRLGAYAEWFAFFPHSASDSSAKPEHYFDGGFTFLVTNDLQLDIEAGVGLTEAADDYFVATGLGIRF